MSVPNLVSVANFKDRLQGAFCGLFLGDSLGAPFEFRYSLPVTLYTGKLEFPSKIHFSFQPVRYLVPGQVTDDSCFSITLFKSLYSNKTYDRDHVLKAYLHLCNDGGLKLLGRNTRDLFKGVTTIKGYEGRRAKIDNSSQSNGSLMRIMPIITLFTTHTKQQVIEFAQQDTNLTNPNEVNREATYIYIDLFHNIGNNEIGQTNFTTLYQTYWQKCTSRENRDAIQDAVNDAAVNTLRRQISVNKGWVCHALYCALFGLLLAEKGYNFEQILEIIIKGGGDTDTNAAITAALNGFYFGYNRLVQSPLTYENLNKILHADWSKGDFPLDDNYHPKTTLPLLFN